MKFPTITYFVSDNEYSSTSYSDDRYFNSNIIPTVVSPSQINCFGLYAINLFLSDYLNSWTPLNI